MKINITQLKKVVGSIEEFRFVTSAGKLFEEEEVPAWLHSDIQIVGQTVNTGRYLSVTGTVSITAAFQCNCCLESFTMNMAVPISDEYYEACDNSEQDDIARYCGDFVDITDLVRESILLAEPLKPMCKENCRGLCQGCGVNLNLQQCSCNEISIDPRLAVLKKLLK